MASNEAVIDANIAIRFAIKGEPYRQKARRFVADCATVGLILIAPPLYESEADSVIRRRVHEGKMTSTAGNAAQAILNALPIVIIYDPNVRAQARKIAEQFNQERVYDSTYAALAERCGCDFWTADKAFYDAVKGTLTFVKYIGDYSGLTLTP